MDDEKIVKGIRESRRAKIAQARNKLNVRNKDPNFEYRVVNDVNDGQRIQQFLDLGWVVDTNTKVGDKTVNKATAEGSPKQISVGQGTKAFVMKVPKELYDEDQAIKAEELNKSEAALKPDGTYGTVKFDKSELTRKR